MERSSDELQGLYKLLAINNDRISCYQKVSSKIKDSDIEAMFGNYANNSSVFNKDIAEEISAMGGEMNKKTSEKKAGGFMWMDAPSFFGGNSKAKILKTCAKVESSAISAYDKVIANPDEYFSSQCRLMLEEHRSKLQEAYRYVESLLKVADKTG